MWKEPISNTGVMHAECAERRREEWQKANAGAIIEPGHFVKLGFPFVDPETNTETKEHMWVLVTKVDGTNLTGTINNDPHFVDAVFGDAVTFTFDEIEAWTKE